MGQKSQSNDAVCAGPGAPAADGQSAARRSAGFGLALIAGLLSRSAFGQMVAPPETVWGDVYQDPAGLQVGGVELLAGFLIALVALLAASAFLAYQKPADGQRIERWRRQVMLCAFVATPLLGLATIILGGPRVLFGVEVALLGVTLSLLSVLIATAALMLGQT